MDWAVDDLSIYLYIHVSDMYLQKWEKVHSKDISIKTTVPDNYAIFVFEICMPDEFTFDTVFQIFDLRSSLLTTACISFSR